jgi:hypothetical protein
VNKPDFYDIPGAAEYLGVSITRIRKLITKGELDPAVMGGSYIFLPGDLEGIKSTVYVDGITIRDLMQHNGMTWEQVFYRLRKYRIKPIGIDRRRCRRYVYGSDTLQKLSTVTGLKVPDLPLDLQSES